MSTSLGRLTACGNGFAVQITKRMAKAAGFIEGSAVRVTIKLGHIVLRNRNDSGPDTGGLCMAARLWPQEP
ncbi:MAG: hypothetical protein JO269_12305 [Burkholderiaceae bacterium]|nr:hypothetical protein [Burkholderiaceae bacterium]